MTTINYFILSFIAKITKPFNILNVFKRRLLN